MSAAPKKNEESQPIEAVDLTATDRELKLAKNFEDPALDELIPGLGQPEGDAPLTVTAEAAEAVHELVQDASAEPAAIDLTQDFSADALPIPEDPTPSKPPLTFRQPSPNPSPLPKTVNPNPDPLERSLIMTTPPETEQTASGSFGVEGQATDVNHDSVKYRMCASLFELVPSERSFDDLVLQGLRAIIDGVDAYTGSVLELDHEHEDFFFRASFGGSSSHTKLKTFRVPLTKGIVGHVAESGQPLLIRNLAEDEKQMRAISLSVGFEAVTCMAAPILVGGQPYGVIEVFNKRDGSLFEEKDLRILEEGVRMLAKVLEVRFVMAELSRRTG